MSAVLQKQNKENNDIFVFFKNIKPGPKNLVNVKHILDPLRIGIFQWVWCHLNAKTHGILLGIDIIFQKIKYSHN